MGRVIRKPTLPLPVSAPKKLKVSKTVSAKPDDAPMTLNRDTLLKQQDAVNTNKVLKTSSSIPIKDKEVEKDNIIGEQMIVECDIKRRERRVSSEVIFIDNDDNTIFSVFRSAKQEGHDGPGSIT